MDHERRFDRDDRPDPPSEGVRIIGAEEAAEAIERGEVAPRRGDDELRYGDRPPPPASAAPVRSCASRSARPPMPVTSRGCASIDPISEPVELPHWTQPPTGQVPQILPDQPAASRDEPEDWASFATSSPRWQDDQGRAEGAGYDAPGGTTTRWARSTTASGPPTTTSSPSPTWMVRWCPAARSSLTWRRSPPTLPLRWRPGTTTTSSVMRATTTRTRPPGGWPPASASVGPRRQPRTAPRRIPRVGGGGGGGGGAPGGPGGMDRDLGQAAIVGGGFLLLALILFKLGPLASLAADHRGDRDGGGRVLRRAPPGRLPAVALAGITASVGMVLAVYRRGGRGPAGPVPHHGGRAWPGTSSAPAPNRR